MTINLSSLDIDESEYASFKELCNDIFRYIANSDTPSLYFVSNEFPEEQYSHFELALNVLLTEGSIKNGSHGFEIQFNPEFKEDIRQEISYEPINSQMSELVSEEKERFVDRIQRVKQIEGDMVAVIHDSGLYRPKDDIVNIIEKMGKSTSRTILKECFIELKDIEEIMSTYKEAEEVILSFCDSYKFDFSDVELFTSYNITYNTFVYVFNRSPAYHRLISLSFDTGFGDVAKLVIGDSRAEFFISRDPNSIEKIDIVNRLNQFIRMYVDRKSDEKVFFVYAYLFLFGDVAKSRVCLIEDYQDYIKHNGNGLERFSNYKDRISNLLKYLICEKGSVKYLSYDNICAIDQYLESVLGINYGISCEKLFNSNKDNLSQYCIDSAGELSDFIEKYTPMTIVNSRILKKGSLRDAIWEFINDVKIYERSRILKMYCRRCGGPATSIESIVDSIDMQDFADEHTLTSEEVTLLSKKLEGYEWLSEMNARSIFIDLHNLKHKFTDINMHNLGFTRLSDAYYRITYVNFLDCLLKNVFVGEELYVDDTKFRINMENHAFSMQVGVLKTTLHWIPVSKYRFINLQTERYFQFVKIVSAYRDKVVNICKQQFITPFMLKNMPVGIPDIDDDDYDLVFYDAVLLATKANHQSLAGYHFYFIPSDSSSYRCVVPDFIRYLIYNNGGVASVAELHAILELEYGIYADPSAVRAQVKQSTCIYSMATDSGYLDQEIYMEMLKNGSD